MLNVSNLSLTDDIDISKCILCQKSKCEYLSKGAKGKANLLNAARILHDDERSEHIKRVENEDFTYHATSCYSTYVKALKRIKNQPCSNHVRQIQILIYHLKTHARKDRKSIQRTFVLCVVMIEPGTKLRR